MKCAHGISITFSGLSDETVEKKMAENMAALNVVQATKYRNGSDLGLDDKKITYLKSKNS